MILLYIYIYIYMRNAKYFFSVFLCPPNCDINTLEKHITFSYIYSGVYWEAA